jgi:uncharacterized protein
MKSALLAIAFACAAPAYGQHPSGPIIDMHLHAYSVGFAKGAANCPGDQSPGVPTIDPRDPFDLAVLGSCAKPFRAPASDDELMRSSLATLRKYNVRRAVTSGAEVNKWRAAAPKVIIAAQSFAPETPVSVEELRRLHKAGAFSVFAEIGTQYRGVDASDPRWEPYWALAEELDIPVGIHMGEGPPAGARFPGYETYRARLSTVFQLEEVLVRHPKLRIYAMHYGSPLVDDTIAMMFTYPNLYVDISCNDWHSPPAQFYDHLKRMVDAGFTKRIMFGSDQMIWPEAIGKAIETVENAPFLSQAQKSDIFYNNAARFLRLTKEQIASDHGR